MHHDDIVVRLVAPSGGTVEDGEVALARLLRLSPGQRPGAGPLGARAMLVAVLGAMIALAVLAVGGLL